MDEDAADEDGGEEEDAYEDEDAASLSGSEDGAAPEDMGSEEEAAQPAAEAPVEVSDSSTSTPPAGVSSTDFVEASSEILQQLRAGLRANHSRVLDLFRRWDRNGDGTVWPVPPSHARELSHPCPSSPLPTQAAITRVPARLVASAPRRLSTL